jgi:hypothetical protein
MLKIILIFFLFISIFLCSFEVICICYVFYVLACNRPLLFASTQINKIIITTTVRTNRSRRVDRGGTSSTYGLDEKYVTFCLENLKGRLWKPGCKWEDNIRTELGHYGKERTESLSLSLGSSGGVRTAKKVPLKEGNSWLADPILLRGRWST